ncbi:MAG: MG2 domain-containing protein [Cyclobacteriaceae bacterium]
MNTLKPVFLLSIFVLLFLSCSSKKDKKEISNEFKTYISGFTSGELSRKSEIRIEFTANLAPDLIGEPIVQKIFSFSPSVKGKTIWKNESTIIFKPDELLDPNTKYEVDFNLNKVMDVPSHLKEFSFSFKTIKPSLRYEFQKIESISTKDFRWQRMEGVVYTSDIVDQEKLEQTINVVQSGKVQKLKWRHLDESKTHFFVADSLERKNTPQEIKVTWKGAPIGADVNGEDQLTLPSLTDFKLINLQVTSGSSPFISLQFSDPIDERQDLTGLIRLKSGARLRYVVEKNEIKVYPKTKRKGIEVLSINAGVKNSLGYKLKEKITRNVEFIQYKPKLKSVGNGVILPNSNELYFPFQAVNLNAVDISIRKVYENNIKQFLQSNRLNGSSQLSKVSQIIYQGKVDLTAQKAIDYGDWNTFGIDLTSFIMPEPGALYRVRLSIVPSYSMYSCIDTAGLGAFKKPKLSGNEEWGYDDYYDYDYYDNYDWDQKDNPCKVSYYMRGNQDLVQNVFASSMGIIAKASDAKEYHVAVSNLLTTEAISGVSVSFYDYQQQIIQEATTDSEGMAVVKLSKKPYLLVATKGEEKGYLRIDDGSSLSLSMFDVSGLQVNKGIKGFIYGDRGVWRPGDSVFVSFMLHDELQQLPENHPVVFELTDPANQLVTKQVATKGVEGLYVFKTKTNAQAKTGHYLAKVKVGAQTFTKSLRIETIKPNRLKTKLDFPQELLTNTKSTQQAALQVNWLHGAKAKALGTEVDVKITDKTTSFKGFSNFHFSDQSKDATHIEKQVFSGKTNGDGQVSFNTNIRANKNDVSGLLNVWLKTTVTENGGNTSVFSQIKTYSPFQSYVGVSIPEGSGWGGALLTDKEYQFPIATVDQYGKPVARKNVSIQVLKIDRSWWMEASNSNYLSKYVSASYKYQVATTKATTATNGKGSFKLKIPNDKGYGRYLVMLTDPVSGHKSSKLIFFDWPDWYSSKKESRGDGATMLSFITDKDTYQKGELVNIEFPSVANSKALISIETGSQILETFWVNTTADKTSFSFLAEEKMTPGVYVSITYIQPHANTENDLPIRLYGIKKIEINDADKLLSPQLTLPNSLEPEKEFTVSVEEKDGKPMSYTLAVVDEGLLSLTNFNTPNPWKHFNAMEALGIKTWDLYDDVLGSFTGRLAGLMQVGGDGESQRVENGYKANRFKPVVKFLGPFSLKKGKTAKHDITLPNYIGAVRVMVVAGNQDGAYGSKGKEVPVKKPLMLLATMPRVIGPGEEVALPVTVFAMDPSINKVDINVKTNEYLQVQENASQQLVFTEEGEQMAYFTLKAPKKLGVAKLQVLASGAKFNATYEVELDVRNPNSYVYASKEQMIEAGQEWKTTLDAIGLPQTQKLSLEVSKLPSINLEKRLCYLIRYPHGCIEQTTSSVFPQLYLADLMEMKDAKKESIKTNITDAIDRIKLFQTPSGGFSYWPGQSSPSEWGTNYALHFLLEAKEKGHYVSEYMIEQAVDFQKKKANNWTLAKTYYRNGSLLEQSYRLYTLAKAGKVEIGTMNRLKALSLPTVVKARLAAAYFLAGRTSNAQSMLAAIDPNSALSEDTWRYTYGSNTRDKAMVLEAFASANKRGQVADLVQSLSADLREDKWMSTQTTAYSLLALSKFVGGEEASSYKWAYQLNGAKKQQRATEKVLNVEPLTVGDNQQYEIDVTNSNNHSLFVTVSHSGRPVEQAIQPASSNLDMTVRYYGKNRSSIDVSQLTQGTEFTCEIKVTNPGTKGNIRDMALTQVFPSGWEITNDRLYGQDSYASPIDYQDIKDDRVYTYFSLGRNKSKTIRIKLMAAYEGKYYLAPVSCEAMYDHSVSANTSGKWVEVVK